MFKLLTPLLVVAAVLCLGTHQVRADGCHGSPDDGERTNDYDIAPANLRLVKTVYQGALYQAGPDDAPFYVTHVWGSAYEMGYAQGMLLTDTLRSFLDETWSYFEESIEDVLPEDMPELFKKVLAEYGLDKTLDWTYDMTREFSGDYFYDEMHGLADALDYDYDTIVRIHMLPELTKGHCSWFGAWGEATAASGKTFQLRALDWDMDGPFRDYPAVTVYHPTEGTGMGHAFVNIGFTGFVGAITGMSEKQVAISEIGITYPDESFEQGMVPDTPPQKVKGTPFIFLLRDVLQFDDSLDDALTHIETANRTCNLALAVGDGNAAMVNGIEYSGYVAVPFSDDDMLPENDTWHFEVEDTTYLGMDWICPTYTQVLGEQLQKYWGDIDEQTAIHNIIPTLQSGDVHIAFYDLTDSQVYVSFARRTSEPDTNPDKAYERQFTQLDLPALFSEPEPQDQDIPLYKKH